jgi:predicted dehydrogenase
MHVALLGLQHPHSAPLLQTLENLPEVRSVTLCDEPGAEATRVELPRSRKVRAVARDPSELWRDTSIEAALIAVRHDRMAALAKAALKSGKHIAIEKPVALEPASIARLQALADSFGLIASVLYPRRLHPCALAATKIVEGGRLGEPISYEGRFLATQVRFRDPSSWLFRRKLSGGGILLWLGCHYLDLIQHVARDEITGVSACLARRSGEKIDVEDTAALTLRFRSGAIGTFHTAYALAFSGAGYVNAAGYDAYLSWNGRSGRLVWPGLDPSLEVEHPRFRGRRNFRVPKSDSYSGIMGERFLRQFLSACRGRSLPPSTLADASRTARIIDAAERSAATGRFVPVGKA